MKMNKNFFNVFLTIFLVFILASSIQAYKLEINRISPEKIDVNNLADIALEIKNMQNEDIKIQISDNLVFNNNGLNLECYEVVIPKNSTIIVNYSNIYDYKFNSPGIYDLNSTMISYDYDNESYHQYIDTDQIEVVGEAKSISQIVNVYQCDNIKSINMQTVSSNNGNFKINFNTGSVNSYNQLQEMEDNNDVTLKSKFRNNLLSNQKIIDLISEQIREGYSYDHIDVNVINETTGVFDIFFKDIKNRMKIVSGTSENSLIELNQRDKKQYNKIILPIFLGVFLIWVILSCIYLILFRNDLKRDTVLELFKPKIKKEKERNNVFVCKNEEECSVKQLIKEVKDLEEKSEIITFIRNNKKYIKNQDYKKYIYKQLNKKQIEELKEIIISSLKEFNKKL